MVTQIRQWTDYPTAWEVSLPCPALISLLSAVDGDVTERELANLAQDIYSTGRPDTETQVWVTIRHFTFVITKVSLDPDCDRLDVSILVDNVHWIKPN